MHIKVEPIQLRSFGDGVITDKSKGARVFIPNTKPPAPEAPPPPPTFSEEELKAAERDGFQKGFLEGVKEGRKQMEMEQMQIDLQCAALASKFEQAVMPLFQHYERFGTLLYEQIPNIALSIAKKVAGEALQENAHKHIADIATRACETMMHEAKMTITAHESLGDKLEHMLQGLASRLPEHTEIIILRDPAMPLSDCRIDWKQGSLEHSQQVLWERVQKAIENLSVTQQRESMQDLNELKAQVLGEDTVKHEAQQDNTLKSEAPNESKE